MMKYLFAITLFFLFNPVQSQEEEEMLPIVVEEKGTNEIFDFNKLEIKPEFPGGINGFYKYIAHNFRVPDVEDISGRIIVSFVIEKDGTVSTVKVVNDLGYGTGEEAARVLTQSPKWTPGIQFGQPVRVSYDLPISIRTSK